MLVTGVLRLFPGTLRDVIIELRTVRYRQA
jgi:hypothetical protein